MIINEISKEGIECDIKIHIFTISATLVGVCLTVISLFIISHTLMNVSRIGEALLAGDSLAFLGVCLFSYNALLMRR